MEVGAGFDSRTNVGHACEGILEEGHEGSREGFQAPDQVSARSLVGYDISWAGVVVEKLHAALQAAVQERRSLVTVDTKCCIDGLASLCKSPCGHWSF
jgi:hypothetical protein